jgi:integrase
VRNAIRQAYQRAGLLYTRSYLPRHTTAMHLLQSGVPFSVTALWLGHESTTTTHRDVQASLATK